MNEGQFLKGQFDGFGRSIDFNGNSQEGFWKRHQIKSLNKKAASNEIQSYVSRPFGKWRMKRYDGKTSEEGIYCGDDNVWNRCVKKCAVKNFKTNEEPRLSIGQSIGDLINSLCMCVDQDAAKRKEMKESSQK